MLGPARQRLHHVDPPRSRSLYCKGGRLDKMMAELFGRATGYCGGKGGSMHMPT